MTRSYPVYGWIGGEQERSIAVVLDVPPFDVGEVVLVGGRGLHRVTAADPEIRAVRLLR